jgi:hypothetical protein
MTMSNVGEHVLFGLIDLMEPFFCLWLLFARCHRPAPTIHRPPTPARPSDRAQRCPHVLCLNFF